MKQSNGNTREKKESCNYITLYGTKYRTVLPSKFKNKKPWTKPNENEVKAFIPGTIIRIFPAEKQKIEKGGKLLVLEAMKMENIITSPKNGTIKTIHVKPGSKVPKGFVMITFE